MSYYSHVSNLRETKRNSGYFIESTAIIGIFGRHFAFGANGPVPDYGGTATVYGTVSFVPIRHAMVVSMMSRARVSTFATMVILALISTPSSATQTTGSSRPDLLSGLVECRAVTDNAQRLACYDRAAAALDSAERAGDVVVVDRAQVTAARRQAFGFSLPNLALFERGDRVDPITEIETTLTRGTQLGDGTWIFTLADGSAWRQIDTGRATFRNRPGQPVRVRMASMGSFLLTVDRSPAIRVKRQ